MPNMSNTTQQLTTKVVKEVIWDISQYDYANFQGEHTSFDWIFNFGPQKYAGQKILKFNRQISKIFYQIFWQALFENIYW